MTEPLKSWQRALWATGRTASTRYGAYGSDPTRRYDVDLAVWRQIPHEYDHPVIVWARGMVISFESQPYQAEKVATDGGL